MINLKRNESDFYYALYKDTVISYDEWGNETGDPRVVYETPVKAKAVISPASNLSRIEPFGDLDFYDKVLLIDDMACPITETTVLCVDKAPSYTTAPIVTTTMGSGIGAVTAVDPGDLIYDYIVRQVAKSQNLVTVIARKVRKT